MLLLPLCIVPKYILFTPGEQTLMIYSDLFDHQVAVT